jgi:hypothetical protein
MPLHFQLIFRIQSLFTFLSLALIRFIKQTLPRATTTIFMDPRDGEPTALDLLFLIDATSSTKCVIRGIRAQCFDTTRDIRDRYPGTVVRFGAVAYRDPVDSPGDRHDALDFTASAEALQAFLESVQSYGGRDDCEDLAGGLEAALGLSWREEAKKSLFLVTDANAHGSRFSGLSPDPHEDQAARLEALVRQLARRRVYVNAINIQKGRDPGAQATLEAIAEIYDEEGGPGLQISQFTPRLAWQLPDAELKPLALEAVEGEDGDGDRDGPLQIDDPDLEGRDDEEMWAAGSVDILRRTLHCQLMSSFRGEAS